MKYTKDIGIAFLVLIIGILCYFLYIGGEKMNSETNRLTSIIETNNKKNEKLEAQLYKKDLELKAVELEQAVYEAKVDSLRKELKKPHDCEGTVSLQGSQIENLEGALDRCKEAKAIYAVKLGISTEMNINNEVVIHETVNMDKALKKAYRKEKRKTWLKGFGTGGFVVGLLIILAL